MIETLIMLLVYVCVVGLVVWLLIWLVGQLPLPEPFGTIARVVIILIAILIVVALLLNVAPFHGLRVGALTPFARWLG